jgi:hypothetical protein
MFNDQSICILCGDLLKESNNNLCSACLPKEENKTVNESSSAFFDKYMDSILISESKKRKVEVEDSPSQKLAKRARRLPADSIRVSKVK